MVPPSTVRSARRGASRRAVDAFKCPIVLREDRSNSCPQTYQQRTVPTFGVIDVRLLERRTDCFVTMSGRSSRAAGQVRRQRGKASRSLKPGDNAVPWKSAHGRWTVMARTQFALVVTGALTAKERLDIAYGADLPQDKLRMKAAYDQCVALYHEHNAAVAEAQDAAKQQAQDAAPIKDPTEADLDVEAQAGQAEADEYLRAGHGSEDADSTSSIPSNVTDASASVQSDASWQHRVQWERAASADTRDSDSSADASSEGAAPPAKAAKFEVPPDAAGVPSATEHEADAEAGKLYKSIKTCAKVYAKRLLRQNALADEVTNRTNYKLERYRAQLTIMKNMLIRGQIDSSRCKRPIRSVEELQAYDKKRRSPEGVPQDPLTREERDAPSFEELRKEMQGNSKKPTSCRTLWLQLKSLFKLKKIRQRLKRQRDAKMVQVCVCVRPRPTQRAVCSS